MAQAGRRDRDGLGSVTDALQESEWLKCLVIPLAIEVLQTMIEGKRLRDIADLPLDLII